VIEFCLPDDPQMLVRLYDDRAGSASWRLARLRSLILRLAAGRLPLMAVGNWPGHRTFYFSPRAFETCFASTSGGSRRSASSDRSRGCAAYWPTARSTSAPGAGFDASVA
jgi:hypothetical protein